MLDVSNYDDDDDDDDGDDDKINSKLCRMISDGGLPLGDSVLRISQWREGEGEEEGEGAGEGDRRGRGRGRGVG